MVSYETLGVPRVINASGMMTHLGGAVLSPPVAAAMSRASAHHVDMDLLKERAGEQIARWAGAEAAWITTGAAAGVALMTAACVAGSNPRRIAQLPHADWQPRAILVQAGHLIHFGAPIPQMIRLGGGEPRPVGWVNLSPAEVLDAAFDETVAAVLFVQSHHCVQKGMLPLPEVVRIARRHGVPVLVDAAAEPELGAPLRAGADLVAYSGGKAFGGPTSGFVCGNASLVAACRAQERGIGRAMKVGKETIMGLMAALEDYVARARGEQTEAMQRRVDAMQAGLRELPYTRLTVERDEAGRPIPRLALHLDEQQLGFSAAALVQRLADGNPPVMVRTHRVNLGIIALDPRPLADEDVPVLVRAVQDAYAGLRRA